ncbi:acyl-CoA thioesterase, partial [Sodaliphilus pleomorphus]|nr:acyl-CoA thioesterase [Sodaliphilus pleomorphus]
MNKVEKKEYVFSVEIPVRDYELDAEGIVNNANYLHYMEYTRH